MIKKQPEQELHVYNMEDEKQSDHIFFIIVCRN